MGGFLYYNKKQNPPDAASIRRSLQALEKKQLTDGRSLPLNEIIDTDAFTIHLYNKIGAPSENLLRFPGGDFILNTGTLIYRQKIGLDALNKLYTDFTPERFNFDLIQGHFCIFIYKNHRLYTFNDFFGVYHVFTNTDHSVISSSFLSVVRSLTSKELDLQAVYEYACEGASFGDDTYIRGVKLLNAFSVHQLNHSHLETRKKFTLPQISADNHDDSVNVTAESLIDYFDVLTKCFGSKVCTALSGGYDSRLILALLLKNGFDPYIYVYGGDSSSDVKIAKSITASENHKIHHDNRKAVKPSIDEFLNLMQLEYYYSDGHGPNGAFTNGAEQLARTARTEAADLQLNGGGGEIFRNFWKLPDRPLSINSFLKSRFDSLPGSYTRDNYKSGVYLRNLQNKIQYMIETEKSILTREEIEKLYVYMRIKYWMGYNTSIQNVRSYALIPLTEPVFALGSLEIPFKQKELGAYEAALIRHINPKLAAYNSCYGYNFSDKPPTSAILKNLIAVNMPIAIKRSARRYRYRLMSQHRPFYLQPDYINGVISKQDDIMQEYFNYENIHDPLMLSRLHTINLVLSDPY